MLKYLESKLLALYVQYKIKQFIRSCAMNSKFKSTIRIGSIAVSFKPSSNEPVNQICIGEILSSMEDDVTMDIKEMEQQINAGKMIPAMVKELSQVLAGEVKTWLNVRDRIAENNRLKDEEDVITQREKEKDDILHANEMEELRNSLIKGQ